MTMKRKAIIYIILSFSSALSVFSQVYDNEPTIYEKYYGSKDENHGYEVLTDEQFNDREAVFSIYTLDGEYIGPSNIGIDLYSVKMSNPKSYQEPTLTVPFMVYGIGPKRDSLYVDCTMEEMRRLGRNYTIGGRRERPCGIAYFRRNPSEILSEGEETIRIYDKQILYLP